MFSSQFQPCPVCGVSVDQSTVAPHTCDPERLADNVMHALRDQIAGFEDRFHEFLTGSQGRFETWLAAREIRRRT